VVTNYLHRPLLPAIANALAPEGILIYETFALGNERLGRPRNPDFLLRPGELLQAFARLTVIAFEEAKSQCRGPPSSSASPRSPERWDGSRKIRIWTAAGQRSNLSPCRTSPNS